MFIFAALFAAPQDKWQDWFPSVGNVIRLINESGWAIILILILVAATASFLRWVAGPPWVWDIVQDSLELFREEIFRDHLGDDVHHHRVTVFKKVTFSWCLPPWHMWSGWLIPVARSPGFATQRRITRFRVPDQPDEARGVAGMTWAKRNTVVILDLPDLGNNAGPAEYGRYAYATRVDGEWLQKKRPLSRSFAGFPVLVGGKPWGVVIVDSRRPRGIDEVQFTLHHRMLARFLGNVFGKADR